MIFLYFLPLITHGAINFMINEQWIVFCLENAFRRLRSRPSWKGRFRIGSTHGDRRARSGEPIWGRTKKTWFFVSKTVLSLFALYLSTVICVSRSRWTAYADIVTHGSHHIVRDASHTTFPRCFCTLFWPRIPSSRTWPNSRGIPRLRRACHRRCQRNQSSYN